MGQRELSAEIIFDSIRGLRIPAETLHEEDGKSIVYIVTGLQAEAVEVEVIGGYDDYIFVRDGADTGSNLRRGSTVIVKATDLEDGKVVRK
ncbi:MAG: hypothetical protein HUJ65_02950 [Oscillospiraceae bacterium]|nr:hypothetical protein [Oscillospiraceae bacterium]